MFLCVVVLYLAQDAVACFASWAVAVVLLCGLLWRDATAPARTWHRSVRLSRRRVLR